MNAERPTSNAERPTEDTLAEQRLARLRSFHHPRVEELEEINWLQDYVARRNSGAVTRREARTLEPLRET